MTSRPNLPANGLSPREHDELSALLNTLADGVLSEAEERRLREIIDRGEPARRVFREFAALHTVLHWDYSTLLAPPQPLLARAEERRSGPWPPIRRLAAFLSAAAVAGTAMMAAWTWIATPVVPRGAAANGGPLAKVTQARFVLPAEGERPLTVGQFLEAGRIRIGGGAVELTLRNGVVVVFEGPGELDLFGELASTLHDGNVVVRMPAGKNGFVVRTPATDVLDLGTEFAVSIGPGNTTDVQVYDGAVITSPSRRQETIRAPRRLVAGEAVRFPSEPNLEPAAMAYRPERFVRKLPADVGVPLGAASVTEEMRHFGPARQAAIAVHPAPPGMVIDGRLDEWADSPGFSGSLDGSSSCTERVDGRMMYDEKCLYIAAHVGDPLPLRSIIDPEIDASWGWRGGAVQVRVSTDRQMGWPAHGNSSAYFAQRGIAPSLEQQEIARNPRLAHLTMWFHAPTKTPCLTIIDGMLTGPLVVNPAGFSGAFVLDADGRGYTMEYAIPWSLLGCAEDPPQQGDVLAAVWQVLWGEAAGRLRREQMVEIRNPDEPLPINVWERAATWGRAVYLPEK
jgi:hypothetical protein